MIEKKYPYYLANSPVYANADLAVLDKFSGETVTHVAIADSDAIETAISATVKASKAMAAMPSYARQNILNHCIERFKARAEELAYVLCVEAGKPIKDARGEVTRLIDTFRIAAEESTRLKGEVQSLDISPRAEGIRGMWKPVPIGPCSFIAPFNFPLNLVAHKVAPAIAVGCPFVLKPSSRTPLGALIIGEVLAETNLPEGAFSILPCTRHDAAPLTTDERFKLLSFTGSPQVGWDMKARCGKKKIVLELGGNAAVVVDADTNISDAVDRIIIGAFYQSGQSCVGVQRIIVHDSIYEAFKAKLIAQTKQLVSGDPKAENTFVGPMISIKEARRLESWMQEACDAGAKLLCGGFRRGALFEATLLEDVPRQCTLASEEAFGPLAYLERFTRWDQALEMVNDTKYGLQAGVFTRDFYKIQQAWDELEVGSVVVGDIPSFRVDSMPYGGVKDSGLGREGIRFAMEDMTEIRNLVIRTPPKTTTVHD